jgi:adhesin HecA-like repeat protein
MNIPSTFNNTGIIALAAPAAVLSGGAIQNSGMLRGSGTIQNPITNSSTGAIQAEHDGNLLITSMSAANSGQIALQGGTLQFTQPLINSSGGLISGQGTLIATGGLTNNGQLQLSGGNTDIYGAVTSTSGSKIAIAGGSVCTFYNNVTINSGGTFTVAAGSTAVFFGSATGASATVSGLATLAGGGGAASPSVNQIDTLTLAPGGRLDVTTNALITTASAPSIRAKLQSGAIFTSQTTAGRGLGYADIGGAQTEVRYTLLGDANLSGGVDVGDLGAMATNYGLPSGASWSQGDFNYDGKVDVGDLGSLATNYGTSLGGLMAAPTGVNAGDTGAPMSSVPEPGMALLLGVFAAGPLLNRRGHRVRWRRRRCG